MTPSSHDPVGPRRVTVALPAAPYEVLVGPGLLDRLPELLVPPPHARRAALVTDPTVDRLHGAAVRGGLAALGLDVVDVVIDEGEGAKSLATLEACYRRLAAAPLGRDDLVVTLGGGVVSDLGGFLAATWHRGVAVAHLPTTLLGQVDAAIGGKTGVNLGGPGALGGKNLVGAFHQPVLVVADTATLASLPERERCNGLGEVAKYGFVLDPEVLGLLERSPAAAVAGDPRLLTEVVVRGAAAKARVVAGDEREAGRRALLNYGHTLGHAVEALTGYSRYRHGEAVALGMVFAARLGERLGVSEPGLADRTVAMLGPLGLPTGGLDLDPEAVWAAMGADKKARGGVRMVLCRRPGDAYLTDPVDPAAAVPVLATLR